MAILDKDTDSFIFKKTVKTLSANSRFGRTEDPQRPLCAHGGMFARRTPGALLFY